MSNFAGRSLPQTHYDPQPDVALEPVDTEESTSTDATRATAPKWDPPVLPSLPRSTVQPTITFEQAYQEVGWQYNAGRDINIINVQSRDELANELAKMQREVEQGKEQGEDQVISPEVAEHLQKQLNTINEQLRNAEPQGAAILEELRETRAYLQAETDKLAQQIPQKRGKSGFFHLLVSVATLGSIAFDLGLTAAIVTGLFGLAAHKS